MRHFYDKLENHWYVTAASYDTSVAYLLTACVVWYLTVRPAPARFQAVKRPMPAAGSVDAKRMRAASAVMPAQTPTSSMSASSSVENRQQNPVSVLNQYQTGLSYQVIGEYGPPHLKTFTVELTVDDQVGAVGVYYSITHVMCCCLLQTGAKGSWWKILSSCALVMCIQDFVFSVLHLLYVSFWPHQICFPQKLTIFETISIWRDGFKSWKLVDLVIDGWQVKNLPNLLAT